MTALAPEPPPTVLGQPLPAVTLLLTPGTDQSWRVTYAAAGGSPMTGVLQMRVGPVTVSAPLVAGVATLELPASRNAAELLGEPVLIVHVTDGKTAAVARGTVGAQ